MIPFPSGMFGSLVSNPFDNAIFGFSSWDPDSYTVNGSGFITNFDSIGSVTGSTIPSVNSFSLATDGAGRKWFHKNGGSILNAAISTSAPLLDPGGVVVVISCQAVLDNSNTSGLIHGNGLKFVYTEDSGSRTFSRPDRYALSHLSSYDFEATFRHWREGVDCFPGPIKGLATGGYIPSSNALTPAYLAGDNIVFVTHLKPTGLTVWQNIAPCTLQASNYRDANGAALNPSAETTLLNSDYSPLRFHTVSGSISQVEMHMGSDEGDRRYDHVAIYPASLGDEYFRQLVNLLLTQKP